MDHKKTGKSFAVLCVLVVFASVVCTALIVTGTKPVLSDAAPVFWNITNQKTAYQNKININTASVEQLQLVEGIGSSIAKRLYDFIRTSGPVRSLDELLQVEGIGEKRIEAIEKIFYAG